MQNAAFRAVGLDWTYELLDVDAENLETAVAGLRAADVAGANVTIPHKRAVMSWLDALDQQALGVEAVNTVVNHGGRLTGFNTDVEAIRDAIAEVGVEPKGAQAVILGAGGSARAAAAALQGAHLTVASRHPEIVDLPAVVIPWNDPSLPRMVMAADLLINATSLGRGGEMPLDADLLPRRGAVIDLVYVAGGTPLVRAARALGLPTADGWGILLAQGARSFELWTGRLAPLEQMRETLQP
jgi:shikimate dehydrogenase